MPFLSEFLSTPFFVAQFHACPSQFLCFFGVREFSLSARLCLGAPCRVHDADCLQSQFSWLVVSPLRRCVGKQTPAAPELQLRDVVLSDQSFCRLREEPSHEKTRICRVTVDFSSLTAFQCISVFQCFWCIDSRSKRLTHFQPLTPKDLAVAQQFRDRCA